MNNESIVNQLPVTISPLPVEEGGGFEALFPRLARTAVGYGETREEALADLLSLVPGLLRLMEQASLSLDCRPAGTPPPRGKIKPQHQAYEIGGACIYCRKPWNEWSDAPVCFSCNHPYAS